jgi:hypothetical protein
MQVIGWQEEFLGFDELAGMDRNAFQDRRLQPLGHSSAPNLADLPHRPQTEHDRRTLSP